MPREAGKKETLNRILPWVLIPSVFLLDRLLKIWFLVRFEEAQTLPVWPGVFHLTRVNNTGAAFGLWRGASGALTVFSALSVLLILAYLSGFLRRRPSQTLAWALVAGGALGNLYDRLTLGYVVDYLDFRVWPVFNLADAFICAGVSWIFFRYASHSH